MEVLSYLYKHHFWFLLLCVYIPQCFMVGVLGTYTSAVMEAEQNNISSFKRNIWLGALAAFVYTPYLQLLIIICYLIFFKLKKRNKSNKYTFFD